MKTTIYMIQRNVLILQREIKIVNILARCTYGLSCVKLRLIHTQLHTVSHCSLGQVNALLALAVYQRFIFETDACHLSLVIRLTYLCPLVLSQRSPHL